MTLYRFALYVLIGLGIYAIGVWLNLWSNFLVDVFH